MKEYCERTSTLSSKDPNSTITLDSDFNSTVQSYVTVNSKLEINNIFIVLIVIASLLLFIMILLVLLVVARFKSLNKTRKLRKEIKVSEKEEFELSHEQVMKI